MSTEQEREAFEKWATRRRSTIAGDYFQNDETSAAWEAWQAQVVPTDLPTLDRTAPERIWLQIDTYGDDDRAEPFPIDHDVTWCADDVGGLSVEYCCRP